MDRVEEERKFVVETIEGINNLMVDNINNKLNANAMHYLIKRMREYGMRYRL